MLLSATQTHDILSGAQPLVIMCNGNTCVKRESKIRTE